MVKGGREVESELSPEAAAAVDAWLAEAPPSEWLFCASSGRRLTPQALARVVAEAARAAGLPHLHPHMFRAAAATDALDAGVPLERVRALLHHEDIRSTLRYDRGARGSGVAAEVAAYRARRPRGEAGTGTGTGMGTGA
jgi:integrase/recombinase XerC